MQGDQPLSNDVAREWSDILDELETRLDVYALTLGGGETPTPFVLPNDLGPLPEELRNRAAIIEARQHDLENRMRERLAVLRGILAGRSLLPMSVYVDAKA